MAWEETKIPQMAKNHRNYEPWRIAEKKKRHDTNKAICIYCSPWLISKYIFFPWMISVKMSWSDLAVGTDWI